MSDLRFYVLFLFYLGVWWLGSLCQTALAKELIVECPSALFLGLLEQAAKLGCMLIFTLYSLLVNHQKPFRTHLEFYQVKLIFAMALVRLVSKLLHLNGLYYITSSFSGLIHTTAPLWTILWTFLSSRELHRAHLPPTFVIVSGIALCAFTDASFSPLGVTSDLLSVGGFSLANLMVAQTLKDGTFEPFETFVYTDILTLIVMLPSWFLHFMFSSEVVPIPTNHAFYMKIALHAVCAYSSSICVVHLMKMITPLSYAILKTSNKAFIILGNIIYFRITVTMNNVIGMLITFVGLIWYSKTTQKEERENSTLPK